MANEEVKKAVGFAGIPGSENEISTLSAEKTSFHENLGTPTERQERYLKTLFGRCKEGFIEIRPLPPTPGTRHWIAVGDKVIPSLPTDTDIYVGVATRHDGKGTKQDIVEIPAAWVDVDFKVTPEEEARKSLEDFPLKPSIVVRSGGGLHLYWVLGKPARIGDTEKIEGINKSLADCLGGDMMATEAAHVLRLPGTTNLKYKPPRNAALEAVNDCFYELSDFDGILSTPARDVASPSEPPVTDPISSDFNGVQEGKRHTRAISLAGKLQHRGLRLDEAQDILRLWNGQNKPPLSSVELTAAVADVFKRYKPSKDSGLVLVPDFFEVIEEAVILAHEFIRKEIPPRPTIIDPWLTQGDIVMVSAPRGVGKTWFVLMIGLLASRFMEIGPWKTETPIGCLYVDGEMSAYQMQKRLVQLLTVCPRAEAPFQVLSADDLRSVGSPSLNLSNQNWREGLLKYLKMHDDIRVLILDNLASMTPGIDENKKMDWDPMNQWLLELRAIGMAVIMVHHTGKSGHQRGTSAREDMLDVSIKLSRPDGYSPEDGARFIVEFSKNRNLFGQAVKPFAVDLKRDEMKLSWHVGEVGEKKEDIIIEMLKEGMTGKKIAEKCSCTQPYVTQVKKKALKDGRLKKEELPQRRKGKPKKKALGDRKEDEFTQKRKGSLKGFFESETETEEGEKEEESEN